MLRGKDLQISTTFNRIALWGVPVATLVFYLTQNYLYSFVSIFLAWFGVSIGYYGQFNLADKANRNLDNYITLTIASMFRMLPLSLGAAFIGYAGAMLSVIAGILFVPAYLLGLKINEKYFTNIGDFFFYGLILTSFYIGY